MTIINPHDMTRHYIVWIVSFVSVLVLAGLAYTLQPEALLVYVPAWVSTIAYVVSGGLVLLAIIFKFVFAREPVAWTLLLVEAFVGTALLLLNGWNPWYLGFYAVAFVGLMILGPYLHFE